MTYKETLFFIGKCLTITHEQHNKILVENQLKLNTIDWDSVVKVSTGHYVFPALYCNLKRADFLQYLPEELVNYMIQITDLNRERNQQIIEQAKELNTLLLKNNITPIFLKGTGNLLENLYDDIAERMLGDIDFIVSKNDYTTAAEVVQTFGYETIIKDTYHHPHFKHYPRLYKNNSDSIAAVEIHKEFLPEKYADEFNFDFVKNDSLHINNILVLSYSNQLNLSIIAKQINDEGYEFNNISLRNAYDVFLLSKKTNAKKAFINFDKLYNTMNCFLALCHETMGKIKSLEYTETAKTTSYLKIFHLHLNDDSLRKKFMEKTSKKLFIRKRIEFIKHSFFNREYRKWMFKRATDKNWQNEKLRQIGIKKRIPSS
jgi:hypothetical protein